MAAIGKTAWFAGFAIAAVLVTGLQLDREARQDSAVASRVPEPFRYFALQPLIDDAYDRHDSAAGVALSRELVRRSPVPSDGLALLAYGQLQKGDENGAVQSLLLAGQRGWRNRFTQDMLIVMALQSREWSVAAQRSLALWRVGITDDRLKDMTAQLLSETDGAKAFANQLGQEKNWATAFISWAGETLADGPLTQTVGAMARHGARVDCAALSATLPGLVREGRVGAAVILWQDLCAAGRMTKANDFAFRSDTEGSLPGPFDWQYPEVDGMEREFVPQGTGIAIRYTNRNAARGPIATRNAAFPAGGYAVTIDADAKGEAGFRPLVLRVTCFAPTGEGGTLADLDLHSAANEFTVPAQDCTSQQLTLMTGRGEGSIRSVTVRPL
ncbi:hypothetical protein [Novosphingobium sp. PhB165]|uniref:hypothetical protein n=1 Tax=Novosphingobium sp. PhB165 TaxID=2485105 RepID=UPI001404A3AE|nr:hypothetical protein [Novosphingobium sp. PhB165]